MKYDDDETFIGREKEVEFIFDDTTKLNKCVEEGKERNHRTDNGVGCSPLI